MYALIWRHLPGPTPLKALTALLLLAGTVALLLTVVFPWAVTWLPGQDVSLDTP